MTGFSLLAAVAICTATPEVAPPASPEQVRTAVDRSLVYLKEKGLGWRDTHKCATCHHVGMMVWTLSEAQRRGFNVDREALADALDWLLAEDNRSKIIRPAEDPYGPVNINAFYAAFALRSLELTKPKHKASVRRMLDHVKHVQGADGSYPPSPAGRPPILTDTETITALAALAATRPATKGVESSPAVADESDPAPMIVAAARKWLAEHPPGATHQALAFRLLLATTIDPVGPDVPKLAAELLARQNPDGGWSQTKEMPSDALATGQSLYALGTVADVDTQAIQRARNYLIATQQEAGTWPMMSRPSVWPANTPKPAEPLPTEPVPTVAEPITYYATAWATLGILANTGR